MIFIDTGAFVARWLPEDAKHADAAAGWLELQSRPERLFTSSFVLDETVTLLARRAGARFAVERAHGILFSERLTMLRPEAKDELDALAALEKFEDQGLGFTDAISMALMRRYRIKRVFTFDVHFDRAGFSVWPA